MVTKKTNLNTKKIILWVYIVLSALFILITIYNNTRQYIYMAGIQNGQINAVNGVIEQALNEECKAFRVYSWEKAVELVNIQCLQKTDEQRSSN